MRLLEKSADFVSSLTLMWQGMAGIFIGIILIAVVVWAFTKFSK